MLEKFYDAKVVDIRDGAAKKGAELGCERTNRREPRNSSKSLRGFRGEKLSKGRRSIRRTRYVIRNGDVVLYKNKAYVAKGVHGNGKLVAISSGKSVSFSKVSLIKHSGGWALVSQR